MQVYGLSKAAAGGVLSMFAVALILGSPLWSWSANRVGRKPVLTACSLLLIAVCGLLYLFNNELSLPMLYGLFFLFFLAGGSTGPVIAAIAKELFPLTISGTAVGTVNLFPFLGGAGFQVAIGAVLAAGGQHRMAYTLNGFQDMFFICLLGAIVSFVAAITLKETLKRAHTR
jgi:MFS family permease